MPPINKGLLNALRSLYTLLVAVCHPGNPSVIAPKRVQGLSSSYLLGSKQVNLAQYQKLHMVGFF